MPRHVGMSAAKVSSATTRAYVRRQPETTVLYGVVREHLPTVLDLARDRSEHGFGYPRFVEREFEKFLACGMLCHGFVRVRCGDCGDERLVAFSCKTRGFCPSCTTRRMTCTAAHLVDRVLPTAPYRQWVLSLPRQVRFLLARDRELLSQVVGTFLRKVFAWQRRRARARNRRPAHRRRHVRAAVRLAAQPQLSRACSPSRRRIRDRPRRHRVVSSLAATAGRRCRTAARADRSCDPPPRRAALCKPWRRRFGGCARVRTSRGQSPACLRLTTRCSRRPIAAPRFSPATPSTRIASSMRTIAPASSGCVATCGRRLPSPSGRAKAYNRNGTPRRAANQAYPGSPVPLPRKPALFYLCAELGRYPLAPRVTESHGHRFLHRHDHHSTESQLAGLASSVGTVPSLRDITSADRATSRGART